ncbi:MAG: hypothetical protein QOF30_2854 [Acidimicrobiaceae bacterium]|jgi:hypothetical protein|nr:hypothetical protein [Acidimicrobiaceae bacterium]
MIEAHPGVHALGWTSKELHYFDRFGHEPFGSGDIDRYHQHFRRPPGRQCGEWTPRYMYDEWTPKLLREAAPQARLLVMLRDPLARFESGLSHDIGRGDSRDQTWKDAFRRGLYHRQLERLLQYFPREQVLVLQFERCTDQPRLMLDRTFAFLGLGADRPVSRPIAGTVNALRRPAVTLSASERAGLRRDYQDDVRRLITDFPELEIERWPNFRDLG